MITQKISICMWKFLGLESIFSKCLLFKIPTKITSLVSVVHYTGKYTQGNMHILNLNFRVYFGRYLLKTILCFLIFYFFIDSKNYAKNKEQNQSRQSVLFSAKVYPAKLSEPWKKREHILETCTCKWFIVSKETYLYLQCMSFLMNIQLCDFSHPKCWSALPMRIKARSRISSLSQPDVTLFIPNTDCMNTFSLFLV